MKNAYIVMVNNKYMMRVHGKNRSEAERVVLDRFYEENSKYNIMTEAATFSREELKEDYFYNHFCNCELMSMWQLEDMIEGYVNTMQDIEDAENLFHGLKKKVDKADAKLLKLEKKLDDMYNTKQSCIEQRKRQAAALGIEIKEDKVER